MRARRLSKPGRILVYLLSFLMAFSSASTFCIQAVYAAVQTVDIKGEETLKGMLSVGSVVDESWNHDEGLLSLLNERDLKAVDYTRSNNILGTYTKSGEITGAPENWLSNVMYEGSVLRSRTFAGFNAVYGDSSDAFVIKEGINEVDVTLVPVSDISINDNGGESDIKTWQRQSSFADRFMLPHMNGSEKAQIDLKDGWAYHTTLFIVGIKNTGSTLGSLYSGNMLSYIEYLIALGINPTEANMQSYMDYVQIYRTIKDQQDKALISLAQWQEWNQRVNDSKSDRDGKKHHHDDSDHDKDEPSPTPEPTPVTEKGRVIMMYMDIEDLGANAKDNVRDILEASKNGYPKGTSKYYILTGGAKSGSDGTMTYDDKNIGLFNSTENKLFEVSNGELKAIYLPSDLKLNGSMTNPETLSKYIAYVTGTLTDKDKSIYDLIMWSHASGPEYGFGGMVGSNITSAETLTLAEIVSALSSVQGDDAKKLLDFIAFDSCYMSNTEVALALAPYADYLIGAETEIPRDGINYTNLINTLVNNPKITTASGLTTDDPTGLGPAIVKGIADKYTDSTAEPATSNAGIGCAITDLNKLTGSSELSSALSDLATVINSKLNSGTDSKVLYELLTTRGSFLGTEQTIGAKDNGLVDLYSFCEKLKEYEDLNYPDDPTQRVFSDRCNAVQTALEKCIFSKDLTSAEHPGSKPMGLSIYFPSEWSQYSSSSHTGLDQIERLLKAYDATTYSGLSDTAMDNYRTAIASYGLWLATGEIMRSYWHITADDDEQRKSLVLSEVKKGLGITDIYGHIKPDSVIANELGSETEINKIIGYQLNDYIQKDKITVVPGGGDAETAEYMYLSVSGTDSDFFDRVEVNILIEQSDDSSNNNTTEKISLGYNDRDYAEISSTQTPNSVDYRLTRYDHKVLKIQGLHANVCSYYDADCSDTSRKGIIPVAYWVKKPDQQTISLESAIQNGYLLVGAFEVEFDTETDSEGNVVRVKDTGKVTSFRNLTDDSLRDVVYDVFSGEKYELLADFDKAYDKEGRLDSGKLYSLGALEVGDDVLTVGFAAVENSTAEYRIVDAFESRYELNGENFRDNTEGTTAEPDPRNLDGFKTSAPATDTVEAKKEIEVPNEINNDHSKKETEKSQDAPTPAPAAPALDEAAAAAAIAAMVTDPLTGDNQTADLVAFADATGIGIETAAALLNQDPNGMVASAADDYSIFGSVSSIGDNDYPVDPSTEHVTPAMPDDKSSGGEVIENSNPDPGSAGGSDGGSDGDGGDSGGDSGSDSGSDSDSGSSDSGSSDGGSESAE